MSRFARNQWWAFILTLSVLLASSASFTSPSYGLGRATLTVGEGGGESGDPDGPGGPTKTPPSGMSPGGGGDAVRPVGDGGAAMRVWSWRLHVVLRSLAIRWLR